MTVRSYLKPTSTVAGSHKDGEDLLSFFFSYTDLKNLHVLDAKFYAKNIAFLSIIEHFYPDDGLEFLPGQYLGEGYHVEITAARPRSEGSGENSSWVKRQELSGKFDTLDIAKAFWELLKAGELLPTAPLCRKLEPTEVAYAKQASYAIALSVQVGELAACVEQLMNQVQAQSQCCKSCCRNYYNY